MKKFLASLALVFATSSAYAAGGGGCGTKTVVKDGEEQKVTLACEHAPIDYTNKSSMQNGAKIFMNYCVGCHSAKYVRYSRMAKDLDIPPELVEQYMMFTTNKIGDHIDPKIDAKMQATWFGNPAPDLSLETRLRGSDWVYTYLLGFYPDPDKQWGVNNVVFKDVAMPHVLADMQNSMSDEEYRKNVGDLVNFMTWMGDPVRHKRHVIGFFVLLFLAILFIPVYLLNKEFWKDVK